MDEKQFIKTLNFKPKENTLGVYYKSYSDYTIEIDFDGKKFDFGEKIIAGRETTQNFSQAENWVVLECVDRLLEKGYKPKNIILEKKYTVGHGASGGWLDILVTRDNGSAYLMIECKTWGKEFDKELKKLNKDGGQLFTYFQQDKDADIIMLYASEFNNGEVQFCNEIIKIEEDYRQTSNVKDFYERWNKQTKANGVFDSWTTPYEFKSKALTRNDLKPLKQEDSSYIFNRFLEILRHNVVSDKPNAFNKIFTLFLCKIVDEDRNENEQLHFQWLEGEDNHISFQKRLTDLYNRGMLELLEKKVTDVSDAEFNKRFAQVDDKYKEQFQDILTEIRLKKNNEFAIKEVYDDASFNENAKVVKEVVELLQLYQIRYNYRQQFLSDFFELLLTAGLKQESGQFFTPVPIARFIIRSLPILEITNQKIAQGNKNDLLPRIIDYSAGSGHFITESMEEVQKHIDSLDEKVFTPTTQRAIKKWKEDQFDWAKDYVYAIEKDYRLVKTAKVSCYLHGDGLAKVIHGDGLGDFTTSSEFKDLLQETDKTYPQDNKQFDIIVSNPPYSVSAFKGQMEEETAQKGFDLYSRLTDQSSEIECLFIERTKQLLKDGGVAGIILPKSILEKSGIYTGAREIILKYFDILAITELGSNTFMATGVNTIILFLRRKSNYFIENLEISVKNIFINKQDVTLNGIENIISEYVKYVWGLKLNDYKSLLDKKPNETICKHELYIEYQKKIKFKEEKEFLDKLLTIEEEKLLYFSLVAKQKIVVVKTGQKNDEKHFLGYKFSDRKETQGIQPVKTTKTIDECTSLYDEYSFDNPKKASTYIYKAFQGVNDFTIDKSLEKNIFRYNLIDLFSFKDVNFDKNFSLTFKRNIEYDTIWGTKRLDLIIKTLESGKRPRGGVSQYLEGVPSLGGEHIGLNGEMVYDKMKFVPKDYFEKSKQGILKDKDILICKDGALTGKVAMFKKDTFSYSKGMINEHVFLLRAKNLITQKYLFYILYSKKGQEILKANVTGTAQGGLNRANLLNIKIPFPTEDVQKEIVIEIEQLEKKSKKVVIKNIDKLKEEILNKYLQQQ